MGNFFIQHLLHVIGDCCYWYRRFPATSSVCHGTIQTTTLSLICEIRYRPFSNSSSIELKWYRSRDEESAGIKGEILNDEYKYKYTEVEISINGSFIRQYHLGILNFNSSDRGYYWCQMVVNNVSLSPSPYGYINSSQCTIFENTCTVDELICAQSFSLQLMAHNQ